MNRTALPLSLLASLGCSSPGSDGAPPPLLVEVEPPVAIEASGPGPGSGLSLVATSERQWTGIAIAGDGRTFVNYPLWSAEQPFAVGELAEDGTVTPFPNGAWNDWEPGASPLENFVCVQALLADDRGRLWVLDPANPRFEGVVEGGPKLVVIDLATNAVERVYRFGPDVALPGSYLNDVRIDPVRGVAYMTDSGDGALVLLELATGEAWRVLDDHPSTQAEGITLEIEGGKWERGGVAPQVHADGIALGPEGLYLYFQALSGRTLYRATTALLRDRRRGDELAAMSVAAVAEVGPSDGLIASPSGAVYLTSLEENAIRRYDPATGAIETVVQDARISWPDSCAWDPDGNLVFTTAQIHRGTAPPAPYGIWRVEPAP